MIKRFVLTICIMLAASLAVLAEDLTGKWVAQVPGRDGTARETNLMFKQDGDKLTGTMAGGQGGDAAISEGKVDGKTVTFAIVTERGKRTYVGQIYGDEIKFKREGGQAPQEFTAKRSK